MSAHPTPKLERWKYSNLPAYVADTYDEQPLAVGYDGEDAFVFSNDADIALWASETYNDMHLWEGLQDVLSLVIPEDTHVDKPVTISMDADAGQKCEGAIHIHLKKNASLTLYDTINCEGWMNRVIHISLDAGAELIHIRNGTGQGIVTNLIQIYQAEKSKYNGHVLNNFGSFMRDQIHTRLSGEESTCSLSGIKLLQGEQHSDTCILIEHHAPNCYSNQNYRNILGGQARGVFQGKVHVHQIAQKTDGYQLCNSILLSDRAEMDTKPELEIYADDVKCSHGATTAQLDEDPLFYLQARGIAKDQAQALLLEAFLTETLAAFEGNEEIYEHLAQTIRAALDAS